jgi:hypothetical protein
MHLPSENFGPKVVPFGEGHTPGWEFPCRAKDDLTSTQPANSSKHGVDTDALLQVRLLPAITCKHLVSWTCHAISYFRDASVSRQPPDTGLLGWRNAKECTGPWLHYSFENWEGQGENNGIASLVLSNAMADKALNLCG